MVQLGREGDGTPPQYSCLENPMDSMKRQKDMMLEDEPPGGKVSNIIKAEGNY